ncbi:unnamed protein product [Litomosoides sigmodontis]|uniref:Uncharacterized protein n=1 Tax=Litomosoides sigmodontis TaxID=42156 RepID=A0A3P6T1S5_LITSI|nr:unnamed protein product [Litomosoides sigmodontis]
MAVVVHFWISLLMNGISQVTTIDFRAQTLKKSADLYDIIADDNPVRRLPTYPRTNGDGNETRDLLHFLFRTGYDHRKEPENDNEEAVIINVSIVVSSIRAVSEVTMVDELN